MVTVQQYRVIAQLHLGTKECTVTCRAAEHFIQGTQANSFFFFLGGWGNQVGTRDALVTVLIDLTFLQKSEKSAGKAVNLSTHFVDCN